MPIVATHLSWREMQRLRQLAERRKTTVYCVVKTAVQSALQEEKRLSRQRTLAQPLNKTLRKPAPFQSLVREDVEKMSEGEIRYALAFSKGQDYKLLLHSLLELKQLKQRRKIEAEQEIKQLLQTTQH